MTCTVRSASPGEVERQLVGVPADRLQCIAGRRNGVPVVDDQKRDGAALGERLKRIGKLIEALRFDDGSRRRSRQQRFESLPRTIAVKGRELQIAGFIEGHAPDAPSVGRLDPLCDRPGVEELVGKDDRRRRKLVEVRRST